MQRDDVQFQVDKYELVYGKPDAKYHYVRDRYVMGDTMAEIAADLKTVKINASEASLSVLLRSCPEANAKDKESHKKALQAMRGAEVSRIVSLNRKAVITALENCDDMDIDQRCKIEKTFGDREALLTGGATESVEHNVAGLADINTNTAHSLYEIFQGRII